MGPYDDGDTAPFAVSGQGGEDPGLASFTKEPRYLVYILNSSLTSDADVNKSTRSAAAAFGALRGVLCNLVLEETPRGKVYLVRVLAILPYGSEVWCLSKNPLAKLCRSNNRCCCAICRITR